MLLLRLFFFLLLLASSTAIAATTEALPDPDQESRAVSLGAQIRCVVCQSEAINDSQADMAHDMRILVREKISQGWSDQQILDFLRARYGDFILLNPPFQANTYLLWLLPAMVFVGASGWIFLVMKKKK